MKTKHLLEYLRRRDGEIIASFGQAKLLRHVDDRYGLRGGTPDDLRSASEWCSLFLHEAKISRTCLPAPGTR